MRAHLKQKKIGLILGSFGDVDNKEEIEEFVKNTLKDPDILPLPKPLRQIIANGGWHIDKRMSTKDTKVLLGKLPLGKTLDIKPSSSQENLRKEAMMHLHT